MRSVYIKDCSRLLDIQESVLYTEVASQRRKKMEQVLGKIPAELEVKTSPVPNFVSDISCEEQEKEIVYFMLRHGNVEFWKPEETEDEQETQSVSIGQYIISEILNDDLEFKNLVYQKIFNEYLSQLEINPVVENRYFVNHPDSQISQVAVDFLSTPHKLSKIWDKHQAFSEEDVDFLHRVVPKAIIVYKSKIMKLAIKKLQDDLAKLNQKDQVEEINEILKKIITLNDLQNTLSKELDRIVL